MEIIGVDPGLVHTGVVMLRLLPHARTIEVLHRAINGPDATAAALWIEQCTIHISHAKQRPVFIEAYRQRSHFGTDTKMVKAVMNFKSTLNNSRVIDNTGVKKIVTKEMMELFGVWKFSTVTNHQDLRSAARIGIFGALKDDELNARLFDVVDDHIKGRKWNVRHL